MAETRRREEEARAAETSTSRSMTLRISLTAKSAVASVAEDAEGAEAAVSAVEVVTRKTKVTTGLKALVRELAKARERAVSVVREEITMTAKKKRLLAPMVLRGSSADPAARVARRKRAVRMALVTRTLRASEAAEVVASPEEATALTSLVRDPAEKERKAVNVAREEKEVETAASPEKIEETSPAADVATEAAIERTDPARKKTVIASISPKKIDLARKRRPLSKSESFPPNSALEHSTTFETRQ